MLLLNIQKYGMPYLKKMVTTMYKHYAMLLMQLVEIIVTTTMKKEFKQLKLRVLHVVKDLVACKIYDVTWQLIQEKELLFVLYVPNDFRSSTV